MANKKIIICSNAYPPNFIGGAELIAHYQAKILKDLGYDVVIFAGELNNFGWRYKIKHTVYDEIPIYRVCLHAKDYSSDFVNFYNQKIDAVFQEVIEAESPDIVHFHNLIGLSVGLPYKAKRKNIKTILTLHDYWGICFKNTLIKQGTVVCKEAFNCTECNHFISGENVKNIPFQMRKDFIMHQFNYIDAFISPSNYLASMYIKAGLPEDKISVIPNGIDIDRFSKIHKIKDNKRVRFSFIGYLGRHKGIPVLLDALSFMENKTNFKLNIIGDGEDRAVYERQVKKMGWNEVVTFFGKINNTYIEKVYQETDALIIPSIWPENQPVTITEAMAARIPVIASRIGGIPELVEDGITGYLFEPGNAKDLALKMDQCIKERKRLRELGENAHNKIVNYTFANQVRKIAKLYDQTVISPIDTAREDYIIVCVGRHVDSICVEAMNILLSESEQNYKFIMVDWLNKAQLKEAKLLWVVDKKATDDMIIPLMNSHLPLLVPEDNLKLINLCRSYSCGLYYNDEFEAVECLKFLAANERITSGMGQNSSRILTYYS
jgi:glycosyltransferase involved in cell wall biosynthesis